MTTITQPFQCDLQPQIQETHRTTQTGTTTHCRTQTRNRLTSKRSKLIQTAPAAHRRYRWLQPLYTEKHKVRAPASSATQAPCNIHAGQFFCDVIVMWCKVSHRPSSRSILLWCIVMWCKVSHRPSSRSILLWCIVMWCKVRHRPSSRSIILLWCIVMWCKVTHRPSSRSILLWCIVMWCKVSHRLHQGQFSCDVLLCDVTPPFITVNSFVMYCYVM